jgi:opacity protein-like surface antigen
MIRRNIRVTQIVAAAIACIVAVASGYGQSLEKGQLEATGQVGIVTDIGTHASLAGSAGGALTDRVFAYGELGWIPLGGANATSTGGPGGGFDFNSKGRIWTLMGGAQYQIAETHSFVPYAGGALGLVRQSQSVTETIGGTTTRLSVSNNNLYVGLGGGARYFVNESWGFKPEFMVFAGDNTFLRFGIGLFFQLK